MEQLKKFLNNGGRRMIIQGIVYIAIGLFLLGRMYATAKIRLENCEIRINKLEKKYFEQNNSLTQIFERLSKIEANQSRIIEILQGKYK